MAIDSGYWECEDSGSDMDEVATLLVKLYADYSFHSGQDNDDYARAVGVAIRLLHDYE